MYLVHMKLRFNQLKKLKPLNHEPFLKIKLISNKIKSIIHLKFFVLYIHEIFYSCENKYLLVELKTLTDEQC